MYEMDPRTFTNRHSKTLKYLKKMRKKLCFVYWYFSAFFRWMIPPYLLKDFNLFRANPTQQCVDAGKKVWHINLFRRFFDRKRVGLFGDLPPEDRGVVSAGVHDVVVDRTEHAGEKLARMTGEVGNSSPSSGVPNLENENHILGSLTLNNCRFRPKSANDVDQIEHIMNQSNNFRYHWHS